MIDIDIIINKINILISYLISPPPPFDQWIAIARAIFIAISLFLLLCLIYFLSKSSWLCFRFIKSLVEFLTYRPLGTGKIIGEWEKIKRRLEIGTESERKLAIVKADSIFNDVLEKMGYTDGTFEARLRHLTPDILPNIEEVVMAHKIRNSIAYDPDYRLDLDGAKRIILIYEKALTDLQIL